MARTTSHGIYERYELRPKTFTRDADTTPPADEDDRVARESDIVKNENRVDPGRQRAFGQDKVLVAEYPPGTYSLETTSGGRVCLFRFNSTSGLLNQGRSNTGGGMSQDRQRMADAAYFNRQQRARTTIDVMNALNRQRYDRAAANPPKKW